MSDMINGLNYNNTLAFNPIGNLRNAGAAYRKNANTAQTVDAASAGETVNAPSPVSVVAADAVSISETAKTASALYDKFKAAGSETAAIFRSALVSMASNFSSNGSSFSNFIGLGAAMAESGNMKPFFDLTATLANLKGINSVPGVRDKLVTQARSTAASFGFELAGEFAGAAKAIVSKGTTAGEQVGRAGVLNGFTKLWEMTSNAVSMTVEEKKDALSQMAKTVVSKGTLGEIKDFINEKLRGLDENAKEKTKNEMNDGGRLGAGVFGVVGSVSGNPASTQSALYDDLAFAAYRNNAKAAYSVGGTALPAQRNLPVYL